MDADDLIAAFRRYQQVRSLSPKTVRRRGVALRQFAAWVHPLELTETTGDLVDEWLATFTVAATRRAYRSDLMAFYTWAVKRDLTATNPVLKTDSIRVPKGLPRPVPAAQLAAILASAEPDVRLMIALAAYAGLRRSEIAALDAADIDLASQHPTLAVRAGKGNKDRIVPIHPELAAILRRCQRRGPVVGVTAGTVGVKVARHLRSLGLEATAHKLRATFGTELARATEGNVILIARMMGHEDISTSMTYVGWAGGAAAEAIGAMFPPAA
jgi:integrase